MHTFINYAHRGASQYAPENTMASFHKALKLGCTGIELDVQATKDHKIVIFHDDVIDKKSNGTGRICDHTYEELRKLDFGSWFSDEYKNEQIVLFEDFAKEFLPKDLTFAIEIKQLGVESRVLDIIKRYKTHDQIYITSFSFEALENVRKLDPEIKIGWLVYDPVDENTIAKLLSIHGNQICPFAQNVKEETIRLVNQHHLGIRLWGIKDEAVMIHSYQWDTDGMTVNFPDRLAKLMRGKP